MIMQLWRRGWVRGRNRPSRLILSAAVAYPWRGGTLAETTLHEAFPGNSGMAQLMRQVDWTATALGPADDWPQSLRSAVSILLSSKAEIVLFWGPELIALYNDAYAPTLGSKHPWALGKPARQVWSEVWDVLGPLFENVLVKGETFWARSFPFLLHRHGYLEETYYDVSYDPVRAEGGSIGGVFCIVSEKTGQVIGERRLRLLRQIAIDTASARTSADACLAAARVLAEHNEDIPFSLLYALDGESVRLVAQSGIEPGLDATPLAGALHEVSYWPLQVVLETREPLVVAGLAGGLGSLPVGPWDEPPDAALVLPLSSPVQEAALWGFLIAGISPRRALDEDYASFLGLVAGQVSAAIASAQAYEDERRRAESLAELDRAKTLFFSNVSHEFRTPLTLMMAPLEDLLASKALSDPESETSVQTAYRNSLRLLRLVNTLLDFSRIESGRIEAVYEQTDVSQLTRDLASAFRSAIERAGLRFVVSCEEISQPTFLDRDMWEKIVLNLLSNALKFTFAGEIRVSLRESDGQVELAVSDTGTGIPQSELGRLFERFHRIRDAESRTHEGSGIGLALVQELARLHGGEATVESVQGRGSTFRVCFPTGSAHLPPDRIGVAPAQTSTAIGAFPFVDEAMRWLGNDTEFGDANRADMTASTPSLLLDAKVKAQEETATVLVVDDNADMRDYIARLLQERWNVLTAADGNAALAEALTRKVDLVLSDIMMPGLDGFELLAALRKHPETSTLPVILLSARAGEDSRIEGLEAGADDYLVKPFASRELIARVRTHLDLSAARREREQSIRESESRLAAEAAALAKLNDAISRLWHMHNLQDGLEDMLASAIELLGADKGNVQLLDSSSGQMVTAAQSGFEQEFLDFLESENTASGRARRTNERVIVEDVEADAGHESYRELARAAGYRAVQSTPLIGREGEMLGVLSTHWRQPRRLTEQDLRRLDLYARQACDFIERTRTDEALRGSEERFRLAAKGARLGAWEWDLGARVQWSNSLEEIYGFAPGTFPGTMDAFASSLHPDDRERVIEQIGRAVTDRSDLELEERILLPSGELRWLHSRAKVVTGDDGTPLRMVGICMDITERKQSEVALAEAHATLVSQSEILRTVQSIGEAVARQLDLGSAVQAVTDAATKLTGAEFGAFFYNVLDENGASYMLYTLSGAERSDFEGFPLPRATPMFEPTFLGWGTMRVADVHEDPRYGHVPPHYGMPKGHLPVRSYLAVPVTARSGEVLGGLFFGHSTPGVFTQMHEDLVTGLAHWAAVALENGRLYEEARRSAGEIERQREDLYAMLMQSPLPIAVFQGEELVCELANAHFIAALGHEDLIGRRFSRARPELEQIGMAARMQEVMISGEPVVLTEQPIPRMVDGKVDDSYWNCSLTPLRDSEGRVDRVMSVAIDVTDEVLARKEMEEAIRLKDQFLGLVSHELRTPISTVVGNALILLRRGDLLNAEARTQALSDIATEGEKLQRVIENLLMLTRMEATGGLDLQPFSLSELLAESVHVFARQNPSRRVVLPPEDAPLMVEGQRDLLAIVTANLIGNAHKYSPDGEPIEVLLRTKESGEVEVRVRDHGIGVDETEMPNLFVPFYRTGAARRYAAGMGLGLAVCKRIIQAHAGRIWAERRPEGGTDFVFTLPLAEAVGPV